MYDHKLLSRTLANEDGPTPTGLLFVKKIEDRDTEAAMTGMDPNFSLDGPNQPLAFCSRISSAAIRASSSLLMTLLPMEKAFFLI